MTNLIEADIESPGDDHWGDYTKEYGDPYPATIEAQARVVTDIRADRYEDPDEVRRDLDAFATQPFKYARPVRLAPADQWGALGYLLVAGPQNMKIVEQDPTRRALTIYNHSTGGIFIAPTSTQQVGAGALYIPGATAGSVPARRIETSGDVYLFTLLGYVPGTEPVQVSVLFERYT